VILDAKGNLYGTAALGGDAENSLVFELSPPASGGGAWTETILAEMQNSNAYLAGLVFDSQGNLYGTGALSNAAGTVAPFELSPPAESGGSWTLINLPGVPGTGTNAPFPYSGLVIDSAGNLYGSTERGGLVATRCDNGTCGTVFKLSPPSGSGGSWTETTLYEFTGQSDGYNPASGLVLDSSGNVYGVTPHGGDMSLCGGGCGVVFKLTPPASGSGSWTETVLRAFQDGADGAFPYGLVLDANGNPYGTTHEGGNLSECSDLGCGVAYALVPVAVAVTSSKNPSILGDTVTFTATITPSSGAVGTMAFASGSTALCSAAAVNAGGQATCSTSALPQGADTVTATYSLGGSGSMTQTVSASQLVQNGGFETGNLSSWTAGTGGCSPVATKYKAHSGTYSAAEGATVHSSCAAGTVWLRQTVTIPSYATSASLTFWYWPKTDNTSYTTNYYALAIKNTSGTTLQNLLITASNAQAWTTKTFNLKAYIGQTIWIYSAYYNNGSTHGGVYVDDFSLNVN
jgi:uncharacterized protein YceK